METPVFVRREPCHRRNDSPADGCIRHGVRDSTRVLFSPQLYCRLTRIEARPDQHWLRWQLQQESLRSLLPCSSRVHLPHLMR